MSVEHTKPFNPLTAGVAQSVVHQISNLRVAGSSPVSRSKTECNSDGRVSGLGKEPETLSGMRVKDKVGTTLYGGSTPPFRSTSRSSSGVERLHGKEEVAGSNPAVGSTGPHVPMAGDTPLQGECGGFDSLRVHKNMLP